MLLSITFPESVSLWSLPHLLLLDLLACASPSPTRRGNEILTCSSPALLALLSFSGAPRFHQDLCTSSHSRRHLQVRYLSYYFAIRQSIQGHDLVPCFLPSALMLLTASSMLLMSETATPTYILRIKSHQSSSSAGEIHSSSLMCC